MTAQTWNKGFVALRAFKKRNGHFLVPRHHLEGSYKLGQWVAVQRYWHGIGVLSAKPEARLNAIGFIWSRRDWLWKRGIAAFQKFKSREGHCFVPVYHVEDGINLGYWVSVQRRNKDALPKDRKRLLNRLGFIWRANGPGMRSRSLRS